MTTRMLMALAALAAIPAMAAPPPGPHWVRTGTHIDGGEVEVDLNAIHPWNGLTRGWWRVALIEPRPDGTAWAQHLDAIDCDRRLTTELASVSLRIDGSIVNETREAESAALTRLSPATPGTAGEMADAAICRLRPRPKAR